MTKIVFVQTNVSQTDEQVYADLETYAPSRHCVYYFNDYGFRRNSCDPELGVVPTFPVVEGAIRKIWLDSRENGVVRLIRKIIRESPDLVVLCDLPIARRQMIAIILRCCQIKVGLRSDKNGISERTRRGIFLTIERAIIRLTYDFLAPISPLTVAYYDWPDARTAIPFPYASLDHYAEIADSPAVRMRARSILGIRDDEFVFLAIVKFVERENPRAVIRAFERVVAFRPNTRLLMVGSGPLLDSERAYVLNRQIRKVTFTGYLPFAELSDYFAASDVLIHLPRCEPWGASVQDALVAGRGVVASEHTGAAVSLLEGPLRKFIVNCDDINVIVDRMLDVTRLPSIPECFRPAREHAVRSYTAAAIAKVWASVC